MHNKTATCCLLAITFAPVMSETALAGNAPPPPAPMVTYHLTWIGGGLGTGVNAGFGGTQSTIYALKNNANGPVAVGLAAASHRTKLTVGNRNYFE